MEGKGPRVSFVAQFTMCLKFFLGGPSELSSVTESCLHEAEAPKNGKKIQISDTRGNLT